MVVVVVVVGNGSSGVLAWLRELGHRWSHRDRAPLPDESHSGNCSALKLESSNTASTKTKKLFSQIINKSEHCLNNLQESSLLLIVSDLPTNQEACSQRQTDSKILLFAFA